MSMTAEQIEWAEYYWEQRDMEAQLDDVEDCWVDELSICISLHGTIQDWWDSWNLRMQEAGVESVDPDDLFAEVVE